MNCYDCVALNEPAEAGAVCVGCGASVCSVHSCVVPRWLTYTTVINGTVYVEPPRERFIAVCAKPHSTPLRREMRWLRVRNKLGVARAPTQVVDAGTPGTMFSLRLATNDGVRSSF